jgi:type II secretory pathway component PulF
MQTSIVARICEYLGILTAAGIGVVKTFEIIRDSMTNAVVQHKLKLAENAVRGGNSISDAFRQVKVLHPFAIRMITIGEISGRIDEQTAYVADVYRDKLNAMVEVLGKTLEPIMLVIMGLIFGAVMGGLLLPIYDLVSKMNA